MMNKPLIIFSHMWAVTAALNALMASSYAGPVIAVYSREQLVCALRDNGGSPVILGFHPHEHVEALYRLKSFLTGRPVMFVARVFYWTDYSLPECMGLEKYQFCVWDRLYVPFSRRIELRRFRQLCAGDCIGDSSLSSGSLHTQMTAIQILETVNRWLYRELSATGLSGYEIRVLSLMTEGRKGNLPSHVRSLHKNNGLQKLGMTKHVMNLYRGVKVRPELQAVLPSLADEKKMPDRREGD